MSLTKQQVSDYINQHYHVVLNESEINKLKTAITPQLAQILIELVGDVVFLIEIRDRG